MVTHLLPDYDCSIEETDYGVDVTLTCTVPAGGEQALNEALAEDVYKRQAGRRH